MYKPDRYRDNISWQSYRAVPSLFSIEQRNVKKGGSVSSSSLRYVIYACNIVILVVGTGTLVVGAWLRTDSRFRDFLSQRYRNVVEEAFWQAPTLYLFSYVLIILGMFMAVVGLVGCCGATTESRMMLIIYASLVCALMLCSIAASVYIIFKKDGIDVEVSDALTYMVQNYYQGAGIIQESLDRLQHTFHCCGNSGCGDFQLFHQDPPRSCDIRCDGCHYRMMNALRIGFSAAFTIYVIVVIAELIAIMAALIYAMKAGSLRQYWSDQAGCYKNHYGSSHYWYPSDRFVDLDMLRSNSCPMFGRDQFTSRQKF